jgi:hypothetical protein
MSRRLRYVAAAAALPTTVAACLLPDFERVQDTTSGSSSAAGGGSVEDPCSARWPAPVPDTSGMNDPEVVFLAVRTLDLGDASPGAEPGFDLDRACSCCQGCPEVPTCMPPGAPICDGPRGADNATASFFASMSSVLSEPVTTDALRSRIAVGQWTLLFQIWSYNGLDDDDQVTIAFYSTTGSQATPVWNGMDAWDIRDDSLPALETDLRRAHVRTNNAYVADGVLVATFTEPRLGFWLGPEFPIVFGDAVVSGRLAGPAPYRMTEGTIAARWAIGDAFWSLDLMRDGGTAVLCQGLPDYEDVVKPALCSRLDSRPDDALTACTAISFGMSFAAEPALPGAIVPSPILPPGCVDGPGDDVCP